MDLQKLGKIAAIQNATRDCGVLRVQNRPEMPHTAAKALRVDKFRRFENGDRRLRPASGAECANNGRFLVSALLSDRQSPRIPGLFPETGDRPDGGSGGLG